MCQLEPPARSFIVPASGAGAMTGSRAMPETISGAIEAHLSPDSACGLCRYWVPLTNDVGECRIRAPRANNRNTGGRQWALTRELDWCGEFVPAGGQMIGDLLERVRGLERRVEQLEQAARRAPGTELERWAQEVWPNTVHAKIWSSVVLEPEPPQAEHSPDDLAKIADGDG